MFCDDIDVQIPAAYSDKVLSMLKTCLRANRAWVHFCGQVRARSVWNTARWVLSEGNCEQQKLSPVTCPQGLPGKVWRGFTEWSENRKLVPGRDIFSLRHRMRNKSYLEPSLYLLHFVHGRLDVIFFTWWRHQMDAFSAFTCPLWGESIGTGRFSAQRPVARSFDVLFDLRMNKRLSKQSRCQWFEAPWRPL